MGRTSGGARRAALEILLAMERGGSLERVLERRLDDPRLDPRDRALATHLVQGTVRLRKYLDWGIDQHLSGRVEDLPVPIRDTLRLAFYQLLYLDRIPESAVVDEHVSLARVFGHRGTAGLVNAVLRSFLRGGGRIPPPPGEDRVVRIAIETSHPEWMIQRWVDRFGEAEARRLAEANNRVPGLAVRVNRLRSSPEELRERFSKAGLGAEPGRINPWVLHVTGSGRVQELPEFESGGFQVQDESSSLVGLVAAPERGQRILDLCCGVGGKTSHLAELMGDRGSVVGVDRALWRLERLRDNCARLGIRRVFVVRADATCFAARPVDVVLLDAPCSGTGVLARRADARWRRREKDLPRLADLQRAMVAAAASLVVPGGRLVYSACSLEPEECEDIVSWFLDAHPGFVREEIRGLLPEEVVDRGGFLRTFPHRDGVDGMFAARMRRIGL